MRESSKTPLSTGSCCSFAPFFLKPLATATSQIVPNWRSVKQKLTVLFVCHSKREQIIFAHESKTMKIKINKKSENCGSVKRNASNFQQAIFCVENAL